jgi:hypothetical protein
MLAVNDYHSRHGDGRAGYESTRVFRHLSPTIGAKQHFLTVNLTVKSQRRCVIAMRFSCLQVPEIIEWE